MVLLMIVTKEAAMGLDLFNCQTRAQFLGGCAGYALVAGSDKGSFTAFIPWSNTKIQ